MMQSSRFNACVRNVLYGGFLIYTTFVFVLDFFPKLVDRYGTDLQTFLLWLIAIGIIVSLFPDKRFDYSGKDHTCQEQKRQLARAWVFPAFFIFLPAASVFFKFKASPWLASGCFLLMVVLSTALFVRISDGEQ